MDQEIENYLKIALDSSVSSYYRKDAIRHLGRARKSVELSNAILKVLNDVDDPSLQREAMDLAAQFAVSESVNLMLPIATGKGSNARHAINVLAKIGGVKAYQCLKDIASAPGFDLSKTAAKRALEDILRREPELANITAPVEGAKEIFNELTEKVTEAVTEAKEAVTSTVSSQVPVEDTGKLKRDLSSMQNKINNLEHQLSKKNAKVEELEEKIRQLKKNDKVSAELKEVKRTLHESRNETASLKASYEKQLALMKGKVISLEEENDDLMRRNSRKLAPKKSGGGCFSILIFFGIFFFIIWFVFSSIFSEASIQHEIPKEIRQKILNK